MPKLPLSDTLATQFLEIAQCQVKNTPFTAIHRIELIGDFGLHDLIGDRHRTEPKFFNPE